MSRWFVTPRLHVPAITIFLCSVSALNAAGQNRLPPIPADKMTDAQRQAVTEFKAARGADINGPFDVLLRSPEVMSRTRAMGDHLRFKSVLPPKLSEFVILLAARHWTQQYEWSVHMPIAIKAGVNPEVVKAVADGRRPSQMSEDETILYDFCSELQDHHGVTDATYARAVSKFGEQGVVDTIGITGYYTLLAMVLNTARVPATEGGPTLAPFPH